MILLWIYFIINWVILVYLIYKDVLVDVSSSKKEIALMIILTLLFGLPLMLWLIIDDVFIDHTKKKRAK